MKKLLALFIILAIVGMLAGCEDNMTLNISPPTVDDKNSEPQLSDSAEHTKPFGEWDINALMKRLYTDSPYSVSYSKLIDTYLIACGLYFDFNSPYLFASDVMIDYQETIEYFSPYKNHAFIQNLGPYVEEQSRNASMSVYVPLLQYMTSVAEHGNCIGNLQSDTFQSDEDFYNFLKDMKEFYVATEAYAFFYSSTIHQQLEQYIESEIVNTPVVTYFNAMEVYTGTRDQIFADNTLHYATCLSVYMSRNNATFHNIPVQEDMYLLSFQSPLGFNGDFDVQDMLDTTFHESLHPFINPGVEQQQDMIQQLSGNKNPADYTISIYENMPWHRITDEAIVRVVQARIYREIAQGDEARARRLLDRQAGIANLSVLFDSLADYENNRDKYSTIDAYLEILVPLFLADY